jgi:hypothetical protein
MWTMGTGETRTYYYDAATTAVLTAGAATSFTTVSLASVVPIANPQGVAEGYFNLTYASASAANQVDFGIVSGATQAIVSVSNGAASTTISPIWLPIRLAGSPSIPSISYKTTSGSDAVTLSCTGFRDYL